MADPSKSKTIEPSRKGKILQSVNFKESCESCDQFSSTTGLWNFVGKNIFEPVVANDLSSFFGKFAKRWAAARP